MGRLFFAFAFFFLISCGGKETANNIYEKEPFNQLTDSIEQNPAKADLYYKRGVLFYKNGFANHAVTDMRKAWDLTPKEEYGLSLTTILKEKNTDSAILFLQDAIQKLPNSIAFQIGLARGYQQKEKTDEALAIVNRIIEKYPGQIDAIMLKSELLKDNKQGESLSLLEKAYSLAPADRQLAYELAFEYAESENEKTLALTDSLIKAGTAEIEKAFYIRGRYYASIKNTSKAIKNYNESLRHNYNFLDAYRDKGQILFEMKQYDAALQNIRLGLKVNATVPEFYFLMGQIFQEKGEKGEAKLNYEKAYGLDKTFIEAKKAADGL